MALGKLGSRRAKEVLEETKLEEGRIAWGRLITNLMGGDLRRG